MNNPKRAAMASTVVLVVGALWLIASPRQSSNETQTANDSRAASLRPDPMQEREAAPGTAADRFAQKLKAFNEEGRDDEWAETAEGALRSSLQDITKQLPLAIETTTCKATYCIANLRWRTYQEATSTYQRILTGTMEPNCRKSIILPEPADENAPYPAQIILHCTR